MDYADDTGYVTYYPRKVWAAIASVGWYLVAISICFWYSLPYIQEKYRNWKQKKDEQEYAAKYHKNPNLLQERTSALEASRQIMQEKYYKETVLAKEKEKERLEKKKEASRIRDLEGHTLGSPAESQETKPNPLKEGYNPLMGDSSRGWRPPRRNRCSQGGCG